MAADVEHGVVVFWEVDKVMLVAGHTVICGCDVHYVAQSLVLIMRESCVRCEEEVVACSRM